MAQSSRRQRVQLRFVTLWSTVLSCRPSWTSDCANFQSVCMVGSYSFGNSAHFCTSSGSHQYPVSVNQAQGPDQSGNPEVTVGCRQAISTCKIGGRPR